MSVLDGPGEGTWSVFAQKVVEERDELRHKLAGEAAHIKSLEDLLVAAVRERDEAQAEIEDLRAEITRLRLERADLRRALVATRRWAGIQPANAKEMRALLEARDDGAEALDYQPRTEDADA